MKGGKDNTDDRKTIIKDQAEIQTDTDQTKVSTQNQPCPFNALIIHHFNVADQTVCPSFSILVLVTILFLGYWPIGC